MKRATVPYVLVLLGAPPAPVAVRRFDVRGSVPLEVAAAAAFRDEPTAVFCWLLSEAVPVHSVAKYLQAHGSLATAPWAVALAVNAAHPDAP